MKQAIVESTDALGMLQGAKDAEAVALQAEARQKISKWPSEKHVFTHTGLNRSARREWKREQRGVSFFRRIATPVEKVQRLDRRRKACRWLAKTK